MAIPEDPPPPPRNLEGWRFTPKIWALNLQSGVNNSARERIGRQNLSQKVPSKKASLGVIFSPRSYRKTHTQNLQILREDTLGATCSAGPFCLLPIQNHLFSGVRKRMVSKRVVLADVPRYQEPERGYFRMFPRNENQNEGTFPRNENRNEGIFAKTTLLRNRPFVSP